MKKVFLFLTFVALSSAMFAAPTVTARFKVHVNSATSISGDVIYFAESQSWSDANDNGWDGTKNAIVGNLQMWVPASFADLATIATDNLEDTPITVQTIGDEVYTFSFSSVTGRALKFYDKALNVLTDIQADKTYQVTLPKNATIANRFYIVVQPFFTVTTNTSGYATYSNSLDLVLEDAQTGDPKVCSATYSVVSDEEGILTLHAEDGVPANTGVIIRGAASTTYSLVPATVAPFTSTNVLEASVEETANPGALCMATIGGVCAFYEYTGAMVAANKAYLPLSILTEGGVLAPRRVRLVVEGATALSESEQKVMAEKVMVNGRILVRKNGQLFSVAGQLVK